MDKKRRLFPLTCRLRLHAAPKTGAVVLALIGVWHANIAISDVVVRNSPSSGTTRVCVLNVQKLLETSPQGQVALASLAAEFASSRQELQQEQAALKGHENDHAFEQRREDFAQKAKQFQDDLTSRRSEEIGKLRQTIFSAAQDVTRSKGGDGFLMNGVVYVADNLDITPEVLKTLQGQTGDPAHADCVVNKIAIVNMQRLAPRGTEQSQRANEEAAMVQRKVLTTTQNYARSQGFDLVADESAFQEKYSIDRPSAAIDLTPSILHVMASAPSGQDSQGAPPSSSPPSGPAAAPVGASRGNNSSTGSCPTTATYLEARMPNYPGNAQVTQLRNTMLQSNFHDMWNQSIARMPPQQVLVAAQQQMLQFQLAEVGARKTMGQYMGVTEPSELNPTIAALRNGSASLATDTGSTNASGAAAIAYVMAYSGNIMMADTYKAFKCYANGAP